MYNNKNNKSKKVKSKTRTIESTTTKYHTLEEEDSL